VSHCDGDSQVQQASQGNTTVQAVGPRAPSDGGAGIAPGHPDKRRSSSTQGSEPAPASSPPSPPVPGVTQVQVGCVEHCYGTTTLNHSGLTLAQIEQLLGQLQPPSPPAATATPGNEQNVTQQAAAQSETGTGSQSQLAAQANGTVQVAGQSDGTAPVAAVNQTAQGIAQLQVGCIFYCSGTRQSQQAQQSNTTVQSVNSGGAGAANTVSRVVWQVQVGCVLWCYGAVETQTAGASDSTVVAVAPPPVGAAPAEVGEGAPPAPTRGQAPSPLPSTGARTRDSGGAPVRVPGAAGLGLEPAGTVQPVDGTRAILTTMLAKSRTHTAGSRVETKLRRGVARRAHAAGPHRPASRARRATPRVIAGPSVVAASSAAQPTLELVIALTLALAALALTGLRRHAVE
jgi:hypothetical protein